MTGLLPFNMAEAAHVRSRGESLKTYPDRSPRPLFFQVPSKSRTDPTPSVCKLKGRTPACRGEGNNLRRQGPKKPSSTYSKNNILLSYQGGDAFRYCGNYVGLAEQAVWSP